MTARQLVAVLSLFLFACVVPSAGAALPFDDETVAVNRATGPNGAFADHGSMRGSISNDGRFVAFTSWATNIGGTPGNVVVRDLKTDELTVASKNGTKFAQGDGAQISGNGRFVVFTSRSGDLVDGVGGGGYNEFAYRADLSDGSIELVSRADGSAGAAMTVADSYSLRISDDGNDVAFESTPGTQRQVYVRHVNEGTLELASTASGSSTPADANTFLHDISGNGQLVLMNSSSGNLAAGESGGSTTSYLRDLTQNTTRSLRDEPSTPCNPYFESLSFDGRYAALRCFFTPEVYAYTHDFATGQSSLVSMGVSYAEKVSDDGRFLAYVDEQSESIVIHDSNYGKKIVSRASGANGAVANGTSLFNDMTPDGSSVVFSSEAQNLGATTSWAVSEPTRTQVFVRRVSGNPKTPYMPGMSPAGPVKFSPGAVRVPKTAQLGKPIWVYSRCLLSTGCTIELKGRFEGPAKRFKSIRSRKTIPTGGQGVALKLPSSTVRAARRLTRRGTKLKIRITARIVGYDVVRSRSVRLK